MKPLSGIRVLDFTWVGAGPFTTKVLSDFGAEVVKVESRKRPDQLRMAEPLTGGRTIEESGYFANRNPNKKSVSIDLKHPEARQLVLALAAQSDVVINSFSRGVMERFGLSYEDIRGVRDDIIYLSMPLGGNHGPYKDYLGYGMNVASLVGVYSLGGLPDRWPVGTGTNYPDHLPNPLHAAFAILAALNERRRSGQGQEIVLSQLNSTMALFADDLLNYACNGTVATPGYLDDPYVGPHGIYPCLGEDRWCAISVSGNEQFTAFAKAIGQPELVHDDRFSTVESRRENAAALDEIIGGWTITIEAMEVMTRLQSVGISAGMVQTAKDMLTTDVQLRARGFWQYLDHPVMGRTVYHGVPASFSGMSNRYVSPAPLLGQHNDELPRLANMPAETIEEYASKGVLK